MKIFLQGMRRSGTTLLFDILSTDDRFNVQSYYEPLAAAKREAIGGGSRISKEDFFAKIRIIRSEFARENNVADVTVFNYGAPRNPSVELSSDMHPVVQGYLRYLGSRSDHCLLKFVRIYAKLKILAKLHPDAKIIHIVRDPRAVITSFLFGKGRKRAFLYEAEYDFFGQVTVETSLNRVPSYNLLRSFLASGLTDLSLEAPDYLKLLALWQFHFQRTHNDGLHYFGPKGYLLINHEEVLSHPEVFLHRVYDFLGLEVPVNVKWWLNDHLDSQRRIFMDESPRWSEAFQRLNMYPTLKLAGYSNLIRYLDQVGE